FSYTLDQVAPTISTKSPQAGAVVQPPGTVTATFGEDLAGSSTLSLKDSTNTAVAGSSTLSGDKRTLTFTPTNPLTTGAYTATATATDLAGNTKTPAESWTFTVDDTPPAAPSIALVNGTTSPASGNDPTPSVMVNGVTAGDTVTVFDGTTQVASMVVPGAATSVTIPATDPLGADGNHILTAKSTDPAGNTSAPSSPFNYNLDTTPPAAPSITSVNGATTSPTTGTNPSPKVIIGGLVAGDTARLFDGGVQVGPAKVVPGSATSVSFNDGTTDFTLANDGAHKFTATSTDPVGNPSAASSGFTYQFETEPLITSVSPSSVAAGGSRTVTVNGVNFRSGASAAVSGTKVSVTQVLYVSSTEIRLTLQVAQDAARTARSLTVSNPTGRSTSCGNCLTVVTNQGYTLVGGDGGIFTFGTSRFHGSMGGTSLNSPIVGIAHTPGGNGYWLVARDGGVFAFGNARFMGSMGGTPLRAPVIGIVGTTTGEGYWLFASDGGIFSFGNATFYGSTGDLTLNAPVVGMAASPAGSGYWMVASDGGIFSFGDAVFHGSMGGTALNEPVSGMAVFGDGSGYWLVARDGGVFNFGSAPFTGSAAGRSTSPVIAFGSTPSGLGYWVVDTKGSVFNFGDADALGDFTGQALNAPIVGFAAVPPA
ncbi:MAG: Ig-like domain-containing protein, partial [Acidimicrobiales bacterium]